MPTLEVKCTVSNCIFHAKGNVCGAEKIEINMDKQANHNEEFASDFDFKSVKKKAATSTDTCCKTFTPKKGFVDSKK